MAGDTLKYSEIISERKLTPRISMSLTLEEAGFGAPVQDSSLWSTML